MSSIELVLYTPLLFALCFLTIQFSLVYLGTQVASSAAREGARIARTGDGTDAARLAAKRAAEDYARRIGNGMIQGADAEVPPVDNGMVRVTVTAEAVQILPFVPMPDISMSSEGPIETFRPDGG